MAARRIEPTAEQLGSAFNALRKPSWPATLEATLADPLLGRLVRINAGLLALGHAIGQDAIDRAHAPVRRPRPQRPTPPLPFDHKMAAAGDRGDDACA